MAKKIKRSPTKVFGINSLEFDTTSVSPNTHNTPRGLWNARGAQDLNRDEFVNKYKDAMSKKDTSRPWWERDRHYLGRKPAFYGPGAIHSEKGSNRLINMMGSSPESQGYGFPAQEGNALGTSAMTKKSGFTMKRGNRPNKHEFFKV